MRLRPRKSRKHAPPSQRVHGGTTSGVYRFAYVGASTLIDRKLTNFVSWSRAARLPIARPPRHARRALGFLAPEPSDLALTEFRPGPWAGGRRSNGVASGARPTYLYEDESAPLLFEAATTADGIWTLAVQMGDGVVGHIFQNVSRSESSPAGPGDAAVGGWTPDAGMARSPSGAHDDPRLSRGGIVMGASGAVSVHPST